MCTASLGRALWLAYGFLLQLRTQLRQHGRITAYAETVIAAGTLNTCQLSRMRRISALSSKAPVAQGTKKRLSSDDDEEGPSAPAAGGSACRPEASSVVAAAPARARAAADGSGSGAVSAARVRKLARAALRAAPGARLKPRKLLRRVAAAGAPGLALEALLAAVAGCARLALADGRVVLAGLQQ